MHIAWKRGIGGPGVSRGYIQFSSPTLADYRWPVIEIVGRRPGPTLCVMGGVHVNEASSIEAAFLLADRLSQADVSGRVSIIPIVNIPGCYDHLATIPVDRKNLHWIYPGAAAGSFSDVLAYALLHEWAAEAEVVIDMHGGDLGEDLTSYVVYQRSDDPDINRRSEMLARCFDAPLIFGLDPASADRPGRSCAALSRMGKIGLVSEAGKNAVLDQGHAQWHAAGAVNVARYLGILPPQAFEPEHNVVVLHDYRFLTAPSSGLIFPSVRGGERARKGQPLALMRDAFHEPVAEIEAPHDGWIMWITTHLLVAEGEWIAGLGIERR